MEREIKAFMWGPSVMRRHDGAEGCRGIMGWSCGPSCRGSVEIKPSPLMLRAIRAAVLPVLDRIKRDCFMPGANPSDAAAAGLLLSKLFAWDGNSILEAAGDALEDANYHDDAATVRALLDSQVSA